MDSYFLLQNANQTDPKHPPYLFQQVDEGAAILCFTERSVAEEFCKRVGKVREDAFEVVERSAEELRKQSLAWDHSAQPYVFVRVEQ